MLQYMEVNFERYTRRESDEHRAVVQELREQHEDLQDRLDSAEHALEEGLEKVGTATERVSRHHLQAHRSLEPFAGLPPTPQAPVCESSAEGSKPKVKGGENINLPKSPNPETYRSRQTATREAVRAASDSPDEAFQWILEANHEHLRDPGKFLTLDGKLLAALTKVAKGELAREILIFKETRGNRDAQGKAHLRRLVSVHQQLGKRDGRPESHTRRNHPSPGV